MTADPTRSTSSPFDDAIRREDETVGTIHLCADGVVPALPGCPTFADDGFLYMCEFSSGVLKVGRTQRPLRRIGHHRNDARKFGNSITRVWLSPETREHVALEARLIQASANTGQNIGGAEYFTGCRIEVVLAAIADLPFAVSTEAEMAASEARAAALRAIWQVPASTEERPRLAAVPAAWAPLVMLLLPHDGIARLPGRVAVTPPGELIEAAKRLAATSAGLSVEDVLEMSYIDMVEHALRAAVAAGASKLRLAAMEAGRSDLLESGWDLLPTQECSSSPSDGAE